MVDDSDELSVKHTSDIFSRAFRELQSHAFDDIVAMDLLLSNSRSKAIVRYLALYSPVSNGN